jgi:4-amino-4-deoxy-L-arabinose transferase-like glycosyltransferase
LRPPLYPFIISVVWWFFGESLALAQVISPVFAVGAAWLLYSLLKEMFDLKTGLVASTGFLLSQVVMSNTDLVLVHGVGVFFVTLAVVCVWRARKSPLYYSIAGMAAALASLTRYPDLLVAVVVTVFVLIHLKDSPEKRGDIVKGVALGALAFVGLWLPWLLWCRAIWGDPFISIELGAFSATAGSRGGADYLFYLNGLPILLTVVGVGLLALGLVTKSWISDRRRLLLAAWFLIFLVVYSATPNRDLRYMVEWAPPLFAIIGLGVSNGFDFLKHRETRLGRVTRGLLVSIVAVWLILLIVGSLMTEIPTFSPTYYGFNPGFQSSVSWLTNHMTTTDVGVADIPPYFMYYTNRFFYDWNYVRYLAAERNLSIQEVFAELHVKYAVFMDSFVSNNNINSLKFLNPIQSYNTYTIYAVT